MASVHVRTAETTASRIDVGVLELVRHTDKAVLEMSVPESKESVSATGVVATVQSLAGERAGTCMHIDMV